MKAKAHSSHGLGQPTRETKTISVMNQSKQQTTTHKPVQMLRNDYHVRP